MVNYANSLKEHRLSRGLSLMDIEKATGIRNGNLSRWENGQVIPNVEFCIQLAQYYNITLDELIGLDTDKINKGYTPAIKPSSEITEYISEYSDIIRDKNFKQISKLCKDITPELRAIVLGYIIRLLQDQGVNTQKILEY